MAAPAGRKALGRSGMGLALGAGVLFLHGCMVDPPCGCSPEWIEESIIVADDQGPVDSARVEVFLPSDSLPFRDSLRNDPGFSTPGAYLIFEGSDLHRFPEGVDTLEIRVTARKGDRRGEERIILGRKGPDKTDLFKRSGRDTLFIR